jgi:cytidylate kinase
VIIAIDGPAGAGKSTVAKRVAKTLGMLYLDTGAMYRAFTNYVLENGVALEDTVEIEKLLQKFDVDLNDNYVYVNEEDVTQKIRSEKVTENVSYISSLAFVRKKMVELQRDIGKNRDIVAEGRDIGTVVFKETKHKFYLEASIEERAMRRLKDEKNESSTMSKWEVMEKIRQRDAYDSTRELSPLKRAQDAILIDSTRMSIEEVCNFIVEKVKGV